MREYVLNVALNQQAHHRFAWLNRTMNNWHMRKSIWQMALLDDHILKDIGLTRADLAKLSTLSNQVDLAREAERMAFLNSRI
jgi:uncharacterized protein YjiS (DUF1127 family)